MLFHLVDAQHFERRRAPSRTEQLDARRHELGGILVGRHHIDRIEPVRLGARRKRADHVVRLVATHAHHRDVQRLRDLEGIGDVGGKILGHLLTSSLVGGIRLMAEGRTVRIHRERHMRGRQFLENRHHTIYKTNQR